MEVLLGAIAIVLLLVFAHQQLTRSSLIGIAKRQVVALDKFARHAGPVEEARFPLKPGEVVVYEMKEATLAETRRGPRVSYRQLDAFTFRFAPGFYYTAAGGKSVSPEPEEEMKDIDEGRATFTNKRVVFAGNKHTREWDFAKLLGWNEGAGGYILMAVSNRQKVSGVSGGPHDIMGPVAFQLAQIVANDGFESAKGAAKLGSFKAREQGRWMRENFFGGPSGLTRFVEQMDKQVDRHLEKMDELGIEEWIEPGKPLPKGTPTRSREPKRAVAGEKPSAADSAAQNGPKTGRVPEELEVVGEFYHQESFAALRELFDTEGDSEHIVEAELRIDPDNPYSDSGMAVAVYVKDLHVGHIPELLAPNIYELIEPRGGRVTLGARVWLDHEESKPNKSSVQLFIDSRLTGNKD